ncbi:MAG: glycosyltransferase family 2 protein [Sedimentisphaerales bacterium]|nr:glycosyltransferase family 2 protein [Sedimentisphaerales bacterium]
MRRDYNKNGPVVSVLLPTFNRPQYFYKALASVLNQSHENLQVIVINDGGADVSDIVDSFFDSRIVFINRKENRGKAHSLNEALEKAEGKYIAYIDDDDIFYPDHIETLVDALENRTDCMAAYSDLYKVYCSVSRNGGRQPLSKVVDVSRDFDRFFMLHFNHVLHVSLMHHHDMIYKTGFYNENLNVLIDWDMTRRLAFFTDFYHIYKITGEYYHPMGDCDRISVQQRKDKHNYLKNVLAIRTTRPEKPWPAVKDLSIIFVTDRLDKQAGKTISSIWQHTFYPYKLYIPVPNTDLNRLNTDMPNIVIVPVSPASSQTEQIDITLKQCEGEYIAVIPSGFPVRDYWIENPVHALINCESERPGCLLEDAAEMLWAAVLKKEDLFAARKMFPQLSLHDSLAAAGIKLNKPVFEELPLQFDNMLQQAFIAQNNGDWFQAADIYEYIAENHGNEYWMKTLAANALYKANYKKLAADLCAEVNHSRPTVQTLLLEAKIRREEKKYDTAIELLTMAERTIEGTEYLWT